ncbi:MAG: mitofilin family membrane protein [Hyphomonas sp.]|uniref:COG4223 family protein n=1 Tax=Hyphomonas sp. TaxID=87 RepID=UPI00352989E2
MTDESSPEPPVSSTEPIDAHFEPADAPETSGARRKPGASGPGWIGAGLLSVLAALGGGVIGAGLDRVLPGGKASAAQAPADLGALTARLDALETGSAAADDLANQIAALGRRVDAASAAGGKVDLTGIEARLKALESVPAGESVSADALSRAVAALSGRLDQLETRPAGVDPIRIVELKAELAELRADMASNAGPDAALASVLQNVRTGEADARAEAASANALAEAALALSGIEAASRRGLPFETDYRALRAALPKLDAVRMLGPVASTGAPTLSALTQDFAEVSEKARKVVPEEEAGRYGWLNRVFGGAVTVRKADGSDEDAYAILSRAEDALQDEDLSGAVAYVGQLTGPPADAMAAWTDGAKRRISLETSLETLRRVLAEGGTDSQ